MLRVAPRSIKRGVVISAEDPIFADTTVNFIGKCAIGAYTFFGEGCVVAQCTIGRFCSIAPNVTIGLGEHPTHMFSTHPIVFGPHHELGISKGLGGRRGGQKLPPVVGNDVWIGANATILRGVRVGDGAIIGAGCLVTRDVAPYSIVGGVPARELKKRFPDEIAFRLQSTNWWNFDIRHLRGIDFSDIEKSVEDIESRLASAELYNYEISEILGR